MVTFSTSHHNDIKKRFRFLSSYHIFVFCAPTRLICCHLLILHLKYKFTLHPRCNQNQWHSCIIHIFKPYVGFKISALKANLTSSCSTGLTHASCLLRCLKRVIKIYVHYSVKNSVNLTSLSFSSEFQTLISVKLSSPFTFD